jgi:hypothetical protein
MNLESHFLPEVRQGIQIAGSLMSKAEVVPLVDFTHMQMLFENLVRELVWRHQRQIAGEREE